MVAGGHRIIAGDVLNLDVLLSSSTPTDGHTLVTYTLIDNRTTITVARTGATIELRQPLHILVPHSSCVYVHNL